MSGKDYVIKYSAMDQLYLLICNRISGWYNELADWSEEYTRLVDMESFQGTSAESAKAYLQEVHGLMICFVQQTLQVYQSRYLLYKNGYYDIDGNIYANIPQEALQDVRKKLRDESEKLQNISDSIDSSVSSVSDLIYLKNPSIFNLKDTMDGLKRELNEFDQKIESYESSELTSVQGEMQGLIDSLQTAIQGYLSNGTNIASYQPGAVAGNTNILDLYQRAMAGSEYVEAHKDEIELAAAEQEEAFAQMQADYEAACEAREAEGQAKLIQGGLAIVIGTIAIVGTAGMATPIVITAGVAGGSAIAYGASTSIEGAQDWYLGSIGDLETAAINPIRDTVFAGNQELYDLWGSLSMTVAGMCVPVGQSINGVAGMGKDVLVKTAIKTIAKETVQDTISDKISGEITEFATEKLNLNEAWSTALNIGIGLGLDKGMDFAGQKIGVSDGPRFTDDMSFDDAKRYNQYWDELEKGIHIDHPGLTRADIDAWNLADAKLDEHIAVSKVDTDAVVELRAKEAAAQRKFSGLKRYEGEEKRGSVEGGIYLGDLMAAEETIRYSEYWRKLGIGSDKTWKEFMNANPNRTIDDYFEIVQKQSPWPLGETGTSKTLKAGDRFFMAVQNDAPENMIGGFGVKERIESTDFVRNNLAVKYEWKTSCNVIREFEVNSNVELKVNAGPVGPQIDLGLDIYLPGSTNITQYDLFSNLGSGIKREDYVHIVDEYWVD